MKNNLYGGESYFEDKNTESFSLRWRSCQIALGDNSMHKIFIVGFSTLPDESFLLSLKLERDLVSTKDNVLSLVIKDCFS